MEGRKGRSEEGGGRRGEEEGGGREGGGGRGRGKAEIKQESRAELCVKGGILSISDPVRSTTVIRNS